MFTGLKVNRLDRGRLEDKVGLPILAIPNARNLPSLLCHELINEASLSAKGDMNCKNKDVFLVFSTELV